MSKVTVSLQWLFGDVENEFRFIDFKKNMKIGVSSTLKFNEISALLINADASL